MSRVSRVSHCFDCVDGSAAWRGTPGRTPAGTRPVPAASPPRPCRAIGTLARQRSRQSLPACGLPGGQHFQPNGRGRGRTVDQRRSGVGIDRCRARARDKPAAAAARCAPVRSGEAVPVAPPATLDTPTEGAPRPCGMRTGERLALALRPAQRSGRSGTTLPPAGVGGGAGSSRKLAGTKVPRRPRPP